MKKNIILSLILLAFVLPSFAQEWNGSSDPPYGWAMLRNDIIKFEHRGKTPITGFYMLYTTVDDDTENEKDVRYVFIISDNENRAPNVPNAFPQKVYELIYHKLDDGKEFCGVLIKGNTVNKDGEITGYMEGEIRIDNDTANLLVDLLYGDSGWNNKTGIKFSMTTSPRLIPPKFY